MERNTRQLFHLVAVVEHGSLSAAAGALNLSQPALSRSIKMLEEDVGGELLKRGRHGARPTELGQRLVVHGRNVLASLARAQSDVTSWHQGITGRLTVGTTSLSARHFMPAAIADYVAEHTGVRISFVVQAYAQLTERMKRGELDLVVGPLGLEPPTLGIESTHLFDDRLVVVARAGHPLLRKWHIAPADLSAYRWVLYSSAAPLRAQVDAVLTDAGVEELDVAIESEASTVIIDMIESTDYLSMHSYRLLKPAFEANRLEVVPFHFEGTRRSTAVFHRPDAELTVVERSFIDHLVRHAEQWCTPGELDGLTEPRPRATR